MTARPSKFSPRTEPVADLRARTVGREGIVRRLVGGLVDSIDAGQARFDLVSGPRGAGKSHLFALVEDELRQGLGDRAIVVALPEDFHPGSTVHLLARVLEEATDTATFKAQRRILANAGDDGPDRAEQMIAAAVDGQPLVIMLENLDTGLAALRRQGQQRLRRILQSQRNWSIFGTARDLVPAFAKEDAPFFGTFVEHRLPPLDLHDCRAMLAALARQAGDDGVAAELETPVGLARVGALRHVLGGQPRAMALIYPHLAETQSSTLVQAVERLAEDLTPYFQEQLARLSAGQRPVMEMLADSWRPLSVGEISEGTLTPPTTTSTHLRRLRGDALVVASRLGREVFYEVADPLFRISRAMKTAPARASALLRLMSAWFGWIASGRWRIDNDATLRRWHEIQMGADPDVGKYHNEVLRRLIRLVNSGDANSAIEELRSIVDDRGDPWIRGWLAALLDASGRSDEARAVLEGLTAGPLMMALFAMTDLKDAGVEHASGPFVAIGQLLRDAFPNPKTARAAIQALTARLRAGELSERDAPFVLEIVSVDHLAEHGAFELAAWLLRVAPTPLPELVSDQLARACAVAWCDDALPELFGGSATLARRLAQGQREWASLLLNSVAALIDIADERDLRPSQAHERIELGRDDLTISWAIAAAPLLFEQAVRGDYARNAVVPSNVRFGFFWWLASGRPLEPVAQAVRNGWIDIEDFDAELLSRADWRDAATRLAEPEREAVRAIVGYAAPEARQREFDEAFPPRER